MQNKLCNNLQSSIKWQKSTFESNYNLYSKCFDSLEIFIYLTPHLKFLLYDLTNWKNLKFLLYDLTNWKNLAMFSSGPFTLIFSPAKEFKVSKFSSQQRFPSSRNATICSRKKKHKTAICDTKLPQNLHGTQYVYAFPPRRRGKPVPKK